MNDNRNKLLTRDGKLLLCNPKWLVCDLMHFSDWQWFLFTMFGKSQPPLFILLFNSIECLLYLRHVVFPLQLCTSFFLSFPMRHQCFSYRKAEQMTSSLPLWAEPFHSGCRYSPKQSLKCWFHSHSSKYICWALLSLSLLRPAHRIIKCNYHRRIVCLFVFCRPVLVFMPKLSWLKWTSLWINQKWTMFAWSWVGIHWWNVPGCQSIYANATAK